MQKGMQVWSEFLDVWPPSKVRSMSLEGSGHTGRTAACYQRHC